jgi:hypothetical protein
VPGSDQVLCDFSDVVFFRDKVHLSHIALAVYLGGVAFLRTFSGRLASLLVLEGPPVEAVAGLVLSFGRG